MLYLLLVLDEIHSGQIAVKWDLVCSDDEVSWRAALCGGKEKAVCGRRVWRDVARGLTVAGGTVNEVF